MAEPVTSLDIPLRLTTGLSYDRWHADHYSYIDTLDMIYQEQLKKQLKQEKQEKKKKRRSMLKIKHNIDIIIGSDICSVVTKYLWP